MVQTVLGKGHKIKDFKLLDFSAMRAHLDIAKQIKRAATDGEKAAAKTAKEELTVSAPALSCRCRAVMTCVIALNPHFRREQLDR